MHLLKSTVFLFAFIFTSLGTASNSQILTDLYYITVYQLALCGT